MKTITLTKSQANAIRADHATKHPQPKTKPHCKHLNNYEPKFRGLHSDPTPDFSEPIWGHKEYSRGKRV